MSTRLAATLAGLLLMLLCEAPTGAQSPTPQNSKPAATTEMHSLISGRVTVQGKPFNGVRVVLWRWPLAEPYVGNVAASTKTDMDGNYRLADVPPGGYFIRAEAPGYVNGTENDPLNQRALNIIDGETLDKINLTLWRGGVVSGKVTDAEGKPVIEQEVMLFIQGARADTITPAYTNNIRTDDRGMFRIIGVPPGRYKVAAGRDPVAYQSFIGRVAYQRAFYPAVTEEAKASVIEVSSGAVVSDIDINLGAPVKLFSMSGRVIDGNTGQPIANLSYHVNIYSGDKRVGGFGPQGATNSNGEFTIDTVPAGSYVISVPSMGAGRPVGSPPNTTTIYGDSARFDVIDKDVTGIEIQTTTGASISGDITVEGTTDKALLARVPQMRVLALGRSKNPGGVGANREGIIRPDGSFVVTGLRPGFVMFSFSGPLVGGPFPLRLMRTEHQGATVPREIEINAGEHLEGIHLVFVYAVGSVRGAVKFENGTPPGKVYASLLQNGTNVQGGLLDARGHFVIDHVPAGEYQLVVTVYDLPPSAKPHSVAQKITVSNEKPTEVSLVLDLTP